MDQSQRAREIFLKALECDSPAELSALLDVECEGNLELRSEVELLLKGHELAGNFLGGHQAGGETTLTNAKTGTTVGEQIGNYKLLQQIGEGGFGIVYMAEQVRPVQRKVALKVIKPGMDTKEVIARFEAERQALAMMDHPSIAKVLDAGTTDAGRPFFVMELVKGIPLTDFCDANRLSTDKRLELFVEVCKAIQHAHQKGVIHRDIKPSNVLVTLHDGKPIPKVIDFGVAKAIAQQLTCKTLFTQYGQMIGTPQYMSPEQAEMSGLDIDTRSDIYSLGILLYELLTGTTPLDPKILRQTAYADLQKLIREDEVVRPSRRLSSLGEQSAIIAVARGSDPKSLSASIHGELDWIVMKALDKDRERRYDTAKGFALDVERYLANEPVAACPPSTLYGLKKLLAKYRQAMIAASALFLVLLVGLAGTLWMWRAESIARNKAQESERKAAKSKSDAEDQKSIAIRQRKLAEEERKSARMANYELTVETAFNAWNSKSLNRLTGLLDGWRPLENEPDLRGFEWRLLERFREDSRPGGSGQFTKQFESGVTVAKFSPVHNLLLLGFENGEIFIKDLNTLVEFPLHVGGDQVTYVLSADFTPDGRTVVLGCSSGQVSFVQFWRIQPERLELATILGQKRLDCTLETIEVGNACVAIGNRDGTTGVFQLDPFKPLFTLKGWHPVYSPREDLIATCSHWSDAQPSIKIWDANSGKLVAKARTETQPQAISFADENSIVFGDCSGTRIYTLDATLTELRPSRIRWQRITTSSAMDNMIALAGGDDGAVTIVDSQTYLEIARCLHPTRVSATDFSPDGKSLVSGDEDGFVKLWNLSNLTEKTVSCLPHYFCSFDISDAMSMVAMPEDGNTIRLWNYEDGSSTLLGEDAGKGAHKGVVTGLAFSNDDASLYSSSLDGNVRKWDLDSRICTDVFEGHENAWSVSESPDGKWLASGGLNKCFLWNLDTKEKTLLIDDPDSYFES
ncbi:MAG: protein kinase, partial [bacterium]|nr:protein kinase [bacterium]